MDLFDQADRHHENAPLAERMRPRTLEEFVGQGHLLGPGKFLLRALEHDSVPSLILWGPPGSGKTTLATIVANRTRSHFEFFSAVLGSVKDVRKIVAEADERRKYHRLRTILFVDEIHRFNKAQQDAFLPFVERGVVTLIGATTENPSFSVIGALLSRCKVLALKALDADDLAAIVRRALEDEVRGMGKLGLELTEDGKKAIAHGSFGDARKALNVLESAAQLAIQDGKKEIDTALVDEAAQRKTLLYDKTGDEHYNVVSAFIKSMRGSDPDAALYWMARMLEAGDDPLFVLRRMVIFASEDVGNADPRALQLAVNGLAAFQFIGMPEGWLTLSQVCTYLACAPKSNASTVAIGRARKLVKEHGPLPVPLKLRNAPTKLMKEMDYGKEYRYPHSEQDAFSAEHYLPDALQGRVFYDPDGRGYEKFIKDRLDGWRVQVRESNGEDSEEDPA